MCCARTVVYAPVVTAYTANKSQVRKLRVPFLARGEQLSGWLGNQDVRRK